MIGFTYRVFVLCLDGGILDLNIDSAKSRKHISNVMMDYNPKSEVWSLDSNGFWFLDTMDDCKSLIPIEEVPKWLRAYLLISGD